VGASFSTGIDCRDSGCQSLLGGLTDFGELFFRKVTPILKRTRARSFGMGKRRCY
jgi:hypothetical protein